MLPEDLDVDGWFTLLSAVAFGYGILRVIRETYAISLGTDFEILAGSFIIGFYAQAFSFIVIHPLSEFLGSDSEENIRGFSLSSGFVLYLVSLFLQA